MVSQNSELSVIMEAKDLCRYIMTVTQKSPKQYRFTFTTRLQNLCMDIIENIYIANEMFVKGEHARENYQKRCELQRMAITKTRLLMYIAQLALEQKAIIPKQYEQISLQGTSVLKLLGGWMRSDKKRFDV